MEVESSEIVQSWRLYLFKSRDCCVASVAKLRHECIRKAVAEMASGTHRFLASAARVFLEITQIFFEFGIIHLRSLRERPGCRWLDEYRLHIAFLEHLHPPLVRHWHEGLILLADARCTTIDFNHLPLRKGLLGTNPGKGN